MPLRESPGILECDFSSSFLEWRLGDLDLSMPRGVEGWDNDCCRDFSSAIVEGRMAVVRSCLALKNVKRNGHASWTDAQQALDKTTGSTS